MKNRILCLVGMFVIGGCAPSLPSVSQLQDAEWEYNERVAFVQLTRILNRFVDLVVPPTKEYWEPMVFQFRHENEEIERGVRLVAYGFSDSLQTEVKITFYPILGGILETEIYDSPYIPPDTRSGKSSSSYYLFIAEHDAAGIDGVPELVGIKEMIVVDIGKKMSRVYMETLDHKGYYHDPTVKAGIENSYKLVRHAHFRTARTF